MTEKNCNELIENLDKLFPKKTQEIISILLGKLYYCAFINPNHNNCLIND